MSNFLFGVSDTKSNMCHIGLVRSLSVVPQELLPMLLKIIKNISMAPAALEVLQNANAIESLVKVMINHLDYTVSEVLSEMISRCFDSTILCSFRKYAIRS